MQDVTVVTIVKDGYQRFCILSQVEAQKVETFLKTNAAHLASFGMESMTVNQIRDCWFSQAMAVVTGGKELVGECAWNHYRIVRHIVV
jgi:hypothetical protein